MENEKLDVINDLTIRIANEDHTLINLLKWTILNGWSNNPVEFCGYNIPHPSDELVLFTIQFTDNSRQDSKTVLNTMNEGLSNISIICEELENQLLNQITN